jgi:hypothetical protein
MSRKDLHTFSAHVPKHLRILGFALAGVLSAANVHAATVSYAGTLSGDDQVQQYIYSQATASPVNFSTDSYGGGIVNGITTPSGGFVPVLSIFNSATGLLIASDGADATCSGAMQMDATTQMCDDASLTLSLGSGSYLVDVSEFPNVPIGPGIADGFLEQGQGNFTGATCGAAGSFYQTDVAPCVQRTGNFALNISAVPEPSTLWLALPALAFGVFKRQASKV